MEEIVAQPSLLRPGVPRISPRQERNPKGIPSLSPGLRAASYPGCDRSEDSPTLKGLQHQTRNTAARRKHAPCCNPFRVEHGSGTQPRVARGSQPWAGRCNPFGIEKQPEGARVCGTARSERRALTTYAGVWRRTERLITF